MTPAFLAAVVMAVALGGCSSSGAVVAMRPGHRFDPGETRISPGETVVFRNESDEAHTVTAYDDGVPQGARYFASGGVESEEAARARLTHGLIPEDGSYEVTPVQPGIYRYFCIPHEGDGMQGTIVVEG